MTINLSQEEVYRYNRHLILPEFGVKGQQKLKKSSVLVVGAGGLGSPALSYLVAAGVGRVGIVDFDVVDSSNLQRQILHSTSTIGKSKLESAHQRLRDLNPEVKFDLINDHLTSENALEIFKNYDVVADGTDNFPTRYLVNDACVLTGKPNIYASIFRFDGQISVFNYEDGPCYRCIYSEPPPPGLVPSCAEGGVLGVLPGVVGSIQANETIKVLTGIGTPAKGRLIMYDALNLKFKELKLRKDPSCKVCGENPEVTELIDYEFFCSGENSLGTDDLPIPELTVEELQGKINSEDNSFTLVDVRDDYEREIADLPTGLACQQIPVKVIANHLDQFDKAKKYIVFCRTGNRSYQASQVLKKNGIENVFNLKGGILQWAEKIDKKMLKY